jgi:hypothetical protein
VGSVNAMLNASVQSVLAPRTKSAVRLALVQSAAPSKEAKMIHTDVDGVSFQVKGKKICFTIMNKKGKNQNYWLPMTDKLANALKDSIKSETDYKDMIERMTPAQKAEHYAEFIT